MRQERISKRPVRRRAGGGPEHDAAAPAPVRPAPADRAHTLRKTDELLRRIDRMIHE